MLPKLSVIIGAAASGKSTYAESLFSKHSGPRIYLATAQSFDTEMERKIARHQEMRGAGWETIEQPIDLAPTFRNARANDAILLDCATLWLSNLLLAEKNPVEAQKVLLDAISSCAAPVVVVTNEVGAGIVPEHAISRTFRDEQGRLNQRLAIAANYVALVVAGLPMVLKNTTIEEI